MYQQDHGHNMPRLVGAAQTTAAGTQAQQITTFNSSGTFTAQPKTTNAWVLALAGGGGGGGAAQPTMSPGRAGGSGVVIVKEPSAGYAASGIWDMNALYDNVKAGTWTS